MPATEGALRRSALGRRFRGCRTDDGTMVRSTLVFVVLVAAAACTPSTQSESATSCATEATIVVDPMEYSLDAEELGQFDGLALVVLTFDSVEAADNRFSALSNPDSDVLESLEIVRGVPDPPRFLFAFESDVERDRALCWLTDPANTGNWSLDTVLVAEFADT